MARAIVAILALVILMSMAVIGGQAALENAGEDHVVTNETWTPDAGNVTVLNESERTGAYYGDTVTVLDENSTEMEAGTDYEWIVDNGTVKALVDGGLDGDANATITYEFQQTTTEQRQYAALLAQFPKAIGLIFPAMIFVLLFVVVRG